MGIGGPSFIYPQTTAEATYSVVPIQPNYPPGDLRRYSANIYGSDAGGAITTAINNAITVAQDGFGTGYILHPGGGAININSSIVIGPALAILGVDRGISVFNYTGTGSAFRCVNKTFTLWKPSTAYLVNNVVYNAPNFYVCTVGGTSATSGGPTGVGSGIVDGGVTWNFTLGSNVNTSGFGRIVFRGIKVTTASGSNVGAAIELNACGYSFYEVDMCWLAGTFLYGLIIDGCEVSHFHHNIIENNWGGAAGANIWLVAGPDRTTGQGAGFTNVITINDNHISGGPGTAGPTTCSVGIIDDGGANHSIRDNNINGSGIAITVTGLTFFSIERNDMENQSAQTGAANILFTDVAHVSGAARAGCTAGIIEGNFFGGDMSAGSSLDFSNGAAFHRGLTIKNNGFRANLGRGASIDVTHLANSTVGPNVDTATTAQHYAGVHNNSDGNTLLPPQNGYTGGFSQAATVYGDTRFPQQFNGAAGQYVMAINGNNASGSSFGLQLQAGKTAADTCLSCFASNGSTSLLQLTGAGDITARGVAICLRATAIETRTSTTTLTNSTQLTYAIPAIGTYAFELVVFSYFTTAVTDGITANVNYSGTFTAVGSYLSGSMTNGTTVDTGIQPVQVSATVNNALAGLTLATYGASVSSTTPAVHKIKGNLIATGTGTLAFAFAQSTSGIDTSNLGVGSYMTVTQLS